jgi:uncharacterized protein with ParB-like and HNH nuclease domain
MALRGINMIAHDYTISQLLAIGEDVIYAVPPYQREYKWGKTQRDDFLEDINNNDIGYFLGSIICINNNGEPLNQRWDLIDGQQRMITISLLFASIYSKLSELQDLNDDQKTDLRNLKTQLVLKKNSNEIRVVPQIQNSNEKDYRSILSNVHIIQSRVDASSNAGNRRLFQAYYQFCEKLDRLNANELFELLEKVNKSRLVMIDAGNQQGAYALFTALNSRGAELTAVDLIKTAFFSHIVVDNKEVAFDKIKDYTDNWDNIVKRLGDNDKVQERFFRQFYNAFRRELVQETDLSNYESSDNKYSSATRSNLIKIYDKLIQKDPEGFFNKIISASGTYSYILKQDNCLNNQNRDDSSGNSEPLFGYADLRRIEGTPSFILLLYLLEKKETLKLKDEQICDIVDYLVRFFVRRNLTERPATNSLTPLFMRINDRIEGQASAEIVTRIKSDLLSVSTPDDEFRKYLQGPVYSNKSNVARFVLCSIEAKNWPKKERIHDLWEKSNGKYIWTIEHIFPQKISGSWIDMVENADEEKTKDLQAKYVHCIGNLTLTGYNSDLGNMSFLEKRDRTDKDGLYIGYKNKLYLNEDLQHLDKWSLNDIERRTEKLVEIAMSYYSLKTKIGT